MSETRKVKVLRRSGYDETFRNTLTANVGTLVPILVDEVIPDTKVNLRINIASALPPLVSDTYMNVRLCVEAFAVPHRLCYGNFEDFFNDYPAEYSDENSYVEGSFYSMNGSVPLIQLWHESASVQAQMYEFIKAGSLSDYFGFYVNDEAEEAEFAPLFAYVAYHLIWQEWYRNPRIQRPAFVPNANTSVVDLENGYGLYLSAFYLPFIKSFGFDSQPSVVPEPLSDNKLTRYYLADGVNILSLRQRNFDLDYFTGAMNEPQQGEMASVKIEGIGEGESGFTIASLRAQNSIQQFRERNNLTSPRYQQQIYARYGTAPSNGVLQRPALLGSATYDVYSHGVVQTSAADASTDENPFASSLGARGGNAFASGSDFIIKGFHAKEPMIIMVLASLVPDVTYSQGINPMMSRYIGKGSITDMANGILQNVGPQVLPAKQLYMGAGVDDVFAYVDRYADWMFIKNQCHGEFRAGGTLEHFVLQRVFDDVPEFGSEFLEIPTDYLDSVLSVNASTMGFAYWMDCLMEYKKSAPLLEYSIPSLQDPAYEHGKTISLRKNGQLL